MTPTIYIGAAAFTVFLLVAAVLVPVLVRPSAEAERIMDVVSSTRTDKRKGRSGEKIRETFLKLAHSVRGCFGLRESLRLKTRLQSAGLRDPGAMDAFFVSQFIGLFAGGFAGSFLQSNTAFWVCSLGVTGYLIPDFWLTRKSSKRQKKIRRSLPDAIDLLVICVDAGLGLDQAMMRVGEELNLSHPEINEEFTLVNLEQRAGKPRLEAWQALADRTKIEEFAAFVNMLTQTDRFGTPIIRALSRFSEEIRLKRRQHAEEAAAKTKIKIIFPLVLCIFPCIFLVLLAPAILSIATGLKSMGN